MLDRLCAARREHLAELFAEWDPASHGELAELLGRLARQLVPAPQSSALEKKMSRTNSSSRMNASQRE